MGERRESPLERPDYVRVKIGGLEVLLDGRCQGKAFLDGKELPAMKEVVIRLRAGSLPEVQLAQDVYPAWGREQA